MFLGLATLFLFLKMDYSEDADLFVLFLIGGISCLILTI